MHVVALTRWNQARALEQELPALAQAIGLGLYDTRLRLVAAPPSIVAHGLTRRARAGAARQRCASADTALSPPIWPTCAACRRSRRARVRAQRREASSRSTRAARIALPYAQIVGVVRAIEVSSESQTISSTERKFAIGTAVLTGGLKMSKKVTKVEKSATSDRQRVAYVFGQARPGAIVLKEQLLRYAGLGAQRGTTTHQSFDALIAELRRRTPDALHDDGCSRIAAIPKLSRARHDQGARGRHAPTPRPMIWPPTC